MEFESGWRSQVVGTGKGEREKGVKKSEGGEGGVRKRSLP